MGFRVLGAVLAVSLLFGCSSLAEDVVNGINKVVPSGNDENRDVEEELESALERIEALEDQIVAATTTTQKPPPTTKVATAYSRISPSYARKIATDAFVDLAGRNPDSAFNKRVELWTESLIYRNPGVTDLSPEEFDAWYREKIKMEYSSEVRAKGIGEIADIMKKILDSDVEDE